MRVSNKPGLALLRSLSRETAGGFRLPEIHMLDVTWDCLEEALSLPLAGIVSLVLSDDRQRGTMTGLGLEDGRLADYTVPRICLLLTANAWLG